MIHLPFTSRDELIDRVNAAIDLAERYGQIDEAHHKMWVIDQMCRVLLADEYDDWVASMTDDDYDYDEGIAP